MSKRKSATRSTQAGKSPVVRPSRTIRPTTQILLFVRAGGRCEFDGCNEYLLEHPLTLARGNYGQMAHVVAFSEDGPRGRAPRPRDVNDVENLMLLCADCHKLIDAHPDEYPVPVLEKYKDAHEVRIKHVTGLGPDRKTTVVQLKAKIAGHAVAIPASQVTMAVAPRYPTDTRGHVIDLTGLDEGEAFLKAAADTIKQKVERLYAQGMDVHETRHISLFALAPIPLLVLLGRELGNKVAMEAYQRHRDTEDWVWKTNGTPVEYRVKQLQAGSERDRVALILSLSGKIHQGDLPKEIDGRFSVYELALEGMEPTPMFLRRRADLEAFKHAYQGLLRQIAKDHGHIEALHLFPAVPAPVAVHCGREVFPKVDPSLLVYDFDKRAGGFLLTMKVN